MLWPAKLMIPLGFTLLLLQGVAEIIKRIGYLAGQEPPEQKIMSADWLAPLMFAALVLFLLLGYPVAFALAANGLLFAIIGIEYGLLTPDLLGALPHRIYGIMQNETLLAIPFFTFMGLVMERSLAEDLLDTIGQLFGPLRGGIAYAVIFVGALLAATTGVVAAAVISMGLISLALDAALRLRPALGRRRDRRLRHAGANHSAKLSADRARRSIAAAGQRYVSKRALLPGLMLAGLYLVYVLVISLIKPAAAPALPFERALPQRAPARDQSNGLAGAALGADFFWCWAPSSWASPPPPKAALWARSVRSPWRC